MDDILTVAALIEELQEMPPTAYVMVVVVKYPGEFRLRPDQNGDACWDESDDVEVTPLEAGEVTLQKGLVYLTTELTDFSEARAQQLGG